MAQDEPGEAPKLPPDARLESLHERLERLQQVEAEGQRRRQGDPSKRAGQMVLSHLVGTPAGAGIVGWLLDGWLGTRPWIMLAMLFLGFAAGVFNVMMFASKPTGTGPDGTE